MEKRNRDESKRHIPFFLKTELIFEKMILDNIGHMQVCEDQALYEVRSARKTMG